MVGCEDKFYSVGGEVCLVNKKGQTGMKGIWMGVLAAAMVLTGASGGSAQEKSGKQTPPPASPERTGFGPRVQMPGQKNPEAPAQPTVVATHGDWVVQCDPEQPKGGAASSEKGQGKGGKGSAPLAGAAPKGGPSCGMSQTVQDTKNPRIGISATLVTGMVDGKRLYRMQMIAPIGVFLPTGIAVEVDEKPIGRAPFIRCFPQACVAFVDSISPETLEKLKKGKAGSFVIYDAPGSGMRMPLSLKGFSKAVETLEKM